MRDFSRLYAACLLILILGATVHFASTVYSSRNTQSSGSQQTFPQSLINYDYRWSFDNIEEWRPYAKADADSAELILGINQDSSNAPALLQRTAAKLGAQIVRFIETKNGPIAAVVDVPNEQMQLFAGEVNKVGISAYVEPNFKVEILMTPNDPYWPDQWGPKKIQADLAWDNQTGSPSVKVAVVDTGVDYTHEDLADNYVSGGYDWVNNDDDPMDDRGHGTHVAGIIAAKINNAKGVAGLAQVKIMAEKVLDSTGSGYYDWVANGIIHAADAGADIINLSLGGPSPGKVLRDAVKYANDAGVLVIAGAGNSNSSTKLYPAGFDGVISVAATDQNDSKVWFSNWGSWIDLAAPGVDIISSVPGGYESKSGTSMACPHVSGVAALAWSQFLGKPKAWINEWLKYTADDLGQPGFDVYFGYGRVNAFKAVTMLPPEHDLILLRFDAPKFMNTGQSTTVKVSIMNFGTTNETNITVQFFINGTLEDTQIVPTLASSEVTEVTFVTDPLPKAKYDMRVNVVPVLGETETDNNAASKLTLVDDMIKVPEVFATIQEAVDASKPGDTIHVATGYYYCRESVFICTENLTIYGEAHNQTAVYGNFLVFANGVHIRNFNYTFGGVCFYGVSNGLVENSYFESGIPSILISDGENITFTNNVSFGHAYNVVLLNSSNAVIENNYIANSMIGIIVDGYGTNYIRNNEIVDNSYGVYFGYWWITFAKGNNVLRNNHIRGQYANRSCGIGITGTDVTHFIHDIDPSNTVQGKPVYYLINQNNLRITPTTHPNVGLLAIVNSSHITVENTVINCVENGILAAFTRDSVVNNVSTSFTFYGMRIYRSSNVSIANSQITTSDISGIYIQESTQVTMRNNRIFPGRSGIYIQESTQVTMRDNRIYAGSFHNFGVIGEELQHFIHDIDTSNTINSLPIYYIVNSQGMTLPKNASYVAAVNSTNIIAKKLELLNNEQGILLVNTRNSVVEDVKFCNNTYGIQLFDSFNNTIKGNLIQSSHVGIELTRSNGNRIYLNNLMNLAHEKNETESVNIWDGRWDVTGNFWQQYVGNDTNHDGIGDTGLPYQGVDTHPLMATHLPGDVNYDGIVNDADLNIFSHAFGSMPGSPNWNPHADVNEDAKVDTRDSEVAVTNYNKTWSDYWKVGKASLTVLARDQNGNLLTMMDVSIDGVKVGKTGSTFLVTSNVQHEIYVTPSNTTIVPGDGKYVYTFSYFDVFGEMTTSNPTYLTILTSASITAYYTRTYYAELKVYAQDQTGAYVTTIQVRIDGQFVGYTGSTFYVLPGQHSISVQSPYTTYGSGYGSYVYTFQRWNDGVTSNPRTVTINSATSLTATYYKEFVLRRPDT